MDSIKKNKRNIDYYDFTLTRIHLNEDTLSGMC